MCWQHPTGDGKASGAGGRESDQPDPLLQTKAVDEHGFDGHPELVRVATENFTSVAGTQICEDFFSHITNHSVICAKKKYRRPEKAFGAGLARKAVSRIHRFKEVEVDVMTTVRHICSKAAHR